VIVLLCVAVVALLGVAGWLGFATRTNEHRALAWQARAHLLKADRSRLERVLVLRSQTLNNVIDQLNAVTAKLKTSRGALSQSQNDVTNLETRQRELANEKAQLEDQQRALNDVASNYVTCSGDLIQLLDDFANGYDTSYSFSVAETDCRTAGDSMTGYQSSFPAG
jgi:septal ring factor EnvC (AmiA/AmiB activator)